MDTGWDDAAGFDGFDEVEPGGDDPGFPSADLGDAPWDPVGADSFQVWDEPVRESDPGWHQPEPEIDLAADVPDLPDVTGVDQGWGFADHDPMGWGEPATSVDHDQDPWHTPPALTDPVVGCDPDLPTLGEYHEWFEPAFPPVLELPDPPTPVDGFPWGDAALLGGEVPAGDVDGYGLPPDAWLTPSPQEVAQFTGFGGAAGTGWAGLLASDDPVTSGLGRWWAANP